MVKIKEKKDFGVMVYEVLFDGCLNGIGSDTHARTANRTYNEVARKISGNGILGKYKSSYVNLEGDYTNADLEITNNTNGQLEFTWIAAEEKYKGTGWQLRENQIVVYYTYDF